MPSRLCPRCDRPAKLRESSFHAGLVCTPCADVLERRQAGIDQRLADAERDRFRANKERLAELDAQGEERRARMAQVLR